MYKLCFFVPVSHLESVKDAIFAAGAGRYGHYDRACWQTPGQGQFRPLPGSDPFCGKTGTTEQVEEYKVETVCDDQYVEAVVKALRQSHPYEEPAFEAWPISHFSQIAPASH